MENRYLYRAKRIDNEKWVIGYLSDPCCTKKGDESYYFYAKDSLEFYCRCIVSASTICQCTGYEGIYEKDIFQCGDERYVIEWCDDSLSWDAVAVGSSESISLGEFAPDEVDVIGNAIDNPELLEVQDGEINN